jgi:hypothetical protein
VEVAVGGQRKTYSPPEISAMILAKLKADAESKLGEKITQTEITQIEVKLNPASRSLGEAKLCVCKFGNAEVTSKSFVFERLGKWTLKRVSPGFDSNSISPPRLSAGARICAKQL